MKEFTVHFQGPDPFNDNANGFENGSASKFEASFNDNSKDFGFDDSFSSTAISPAMNDPFAAGSAAASDPFGDREGPPDVSIPKPVRMF